MPNVPLTDKEKQMRAEALRRFNVGGMFNIDQKAIDAAVAKYKPLVDVDSNIDPNLTVDPGPLIQPLPYEGQDLIPTEDATTIAAREAGFVNPDGSVSSDEYLTSLQNNAMFDTMDSLGGDNMTQAQVDAVKDAVTAATESGTTLTQEELMLLV